MYNNNVVDASLVNRA